jgi:hypothetical protein
MEQKGTLGYEVKVDDIETRIRANPEKPIAELLSEAERTFYRDHLLLDWQIAKEAIEKAKAREMELRVKLVSKFAGFDPDKVKGTENLELGNGWKLKSVKKLNYGFIKNADDKTDKQAIDAALGKIEATGEVGRYIAEKLVKWTPDLSVSEYNELSPEFKAIIDTVIVTSSGAPTLEIVPPKGSKK